jgi:glycosyltransferase involved in cell wall biosynthesis
LKILFLNFRNNSSSAVLRISESLNKVDVDVCILSYLSHVKRSEIFQVKGFGNVLLSILFWYDIFVTRFVYKKTGRLFSRNSSLFSGFLSKIYNNFFKKFDLIHVHWIGHGYISSDFLVKVKSEKIVLTLHDYYFITGGCHIPGECLNYRNSCLSCPAKSGFLDFPYINFKQKENLYVAKKIYVTAPSQTMKNKINESHLGDLFQDILVVPNPIDISIYRPLVINFKSETLFSKLPTNKKFILFVSNNLVDFNKGLDLLLESLKLIKNLESICLLTVGNNWSKIIDDINFSHYHFGEISSTEDMIKIYNLSYVTLVSSRFESFSQVTLEAMACSSPVIAFNSSGPSEIITNNIDGYLVESFSTKSYAEKIDMIISDKELRNYLSKNARVKAIEKYSYEAIGIIMKDYYKKIIDA